MKKLLLCLSLLPENTEQSRYGILFREQLVHRTVKGRWFRVETIHDIIQFQFQIVFLLLGGGFASPQCQDSLFPRPPALKAFWDHWAASGVNVLLNQLASMGPRTNVEQHWTKGRPGLEKTPGLPWRPIPSQGGIEEMEEPIALSNAVALKLPWS